LTTDTETKDLFHKLASAEAKHKESVLAAYRITSGKELDRDSPLRKKYEGVMEGGVKVEEAIAFLQGKESTVEDMIELAMQVETNALDLYIKIRRGIRSETAGKVFLSLIEEEKRHLSRLGSLLEERLSRS
jgi:rubrerythrin